MPAREEALILPKYGGAPPPLREREEVDPKKAFEEQYKAVVYQAKNLAEALQDESVEFKPLQRYVVVTPDNILRAGFQPSLIDFTQSDELNKLLLARYQTQPDKFLFTHPDLGAIFVLISNQAGEVEQRFLTALQNFDAVHAGLAKQDLQNVPDSELEILSTYTPTQLGFAKLCYDFYTTAKFTGKLENEQQPPLYYYNVQVHVPGGLTTGEIAACMKMEPVPLKFLSTYQPLPATDKKLLPGMLSFIKQKFSKSVFQDFLEAQESQQRTFDFVIKNITPVHQARDHYQVLIAI